MTTSGQSWKLGLASWLVIGEAIVAFCGESVLAQITPDTTLGNENSTVTSTGTVDSINGGATRGTNLFHSFQEFNIDKGRAAVFTNPVGIENILTRVTGDNPSNILGTLGVSGGNANLFLINPNGIVFGSNASLNVGGSFVASTANALQFENLGFFSATNKNIPSPLLTINPSALLFNQLNQTAAIQNNSVAPARRNPAGFDAFGLRVPDGKSLLLVGGNLSMDGGQLNAWGGRVELGGLAERGSVLLGVDGDNLSLRFPSNVALADISLTNQAGVFVIGSGGGNIAVNARNVEILGGSFFSGGIGRVGTPETVAGDITLNATGEILIAGTGSRVDNRVRLGSKGNGGNITIDSGSFSLRDRAQLEASTFGQGNAGNVTVRARDAVSLANASILSRVGAGGVGKGGNIDINAATLSLIDAAQLQTVTDGASDTQPAGRGNAGNVNINVTGAVDIAGRLGRAGSTRIASAVETGTVGNGGNITIDAGSFSLRDGAQLEASTFGQGNAGNVTVRTLDAVSLAAGASILSRVEPGGVGKGGNIDINAATLSLIGGAGLRTVTDRASGTQPAGRGDAGNVNVNVTGAVDITGRVNRSPSGIFSYVGTGTVGNAGNITINSGSFWLRDRAQLETSTFGQGNAGNVTMRALDAVSLANASIPSRVGVGGVGKGGYIDINAATLSLIDAAQLQTVTDSASDTQPAGRGNAGNVNINVTGAVDIAGRGRSGSTRIASAVETGTVGNAGNITIYSGSLSLRDGAQLEASTFGQGNAGNVTVRTLDAVSLTGGASILSRVAPGGVGKGGNIDINAATLSLINGAQLRTDTYGASDTQPAGRGDAGNVNVNVTGAVDLTGRVDRSPSGIISFVGTGTVGNGGNITIDSGSFSLSDRAQLSAETFGQGNAGTIKVNAAALVTISANSSNLKGGLFVNSQSPTGTTGDIIVTSPKITLEDRGTLKAESASVNGGDVNLQTDLLLLNRGAQISTTAGTAQAGGNGGNINIDAPSGFIVAGVRENNDITANAFTGSGGRVTINATSIFGIAPLSRQELERLRPKDLDARQLPTNDITAISQTNPSISGQITLNIPNVDPNSGLINLPVVPVDTQVSQACTPGSSQSKSEFVVTGRGGLPPSPQETLSSDAIQVNWVTLNPKVENRSSPNASTSTAPHPDPIVEAQGWVIDNNGEVVLTASASTATPNKSWQIPANCRPTRNSS